ncbi:hypothetical protein FC84_GL000750 [Lapidilactobacillus dextrinicus DSM 20335]|uniref:Diaminopimelate decarboxylase n=1 Tax=Lapidilactobacillus dextrinicus DSM 20335 TaxID=1423738 RepID=A0A0R2BFS9_9LACO|nr:hypothetical protein [Lapidilactobacillus dextrinicus]KRM78493.1 hypothetical protein FC84_GL000750 [Lapidilactobacillus dextrinicus DSM 20335]QFG46179.1 pyridoxal-dependent decarboxylase [Lapidilactobacillus dextrinicus]
METPYFVINQAELTANIQELKTALAQTFSKSIIGYSFKTNALPWILGFMKEAGCYAEVVSDDEYQLAQTIGFSPKQIIYNGPAKSEATFVEALNNGAIINLETHRELRWLEKYHTAATKVGLRLQIDIEALCPGEAAMGELGGRFGFQLTELSEILQFLQKIDVQLAGIHLHSSSKTRSLKIYQTLAQQAVAIINQYQLQLDYLDIGGGFFGGAQAKPSFLDYMTAIKEQLYQSPRSADLTLIVEPGASLIATPVSYVTSVIDVKQTPRQNYILTDGSRIHIDPFFRKDHYEVKIEPQTNQQSVARQIITGFTCMENDHLFHLIDQPLLQEGQEIIYHKVGSYTMCFNPLFIKYFPDVYVQTETGLELVRKRWTVKEFIQGAEWL